MIYESFQPQDTLSALVKCYWTLDGPKAVPAQKQRILPDGCMEMIFHHADLYLQYSNTNSSFVQPRCFVIGQLTQPLEIEATGITGIFSVRFHPDGFLPFATLPIKCFENTALPLQELFGQQGMEVEQAILGAQNTRQRIAVIEAFLINQMGRPEAIDRTVKAIVATILSTKGHARIAELSQSNKINRRQLERRFSETIGLSPKQLAKTIRLQAAMKRLLSGTYTSLTELAYESEYYDQAHFIKDFKAFTGHTPKTFFSNDLELSALFCAST